MTERYALSPGQMFAVLSTICNGLQLDKIISYHSAKFALLFNLVTNLNVIFPRLCHSFLILVIYKLHFGIPL